ncbi:MAG: hypothetical protein J6K55_13195 [Clostridia bacterium]|nr:hypothetical protein [Clostridia bacterium]
MISAFWMMIILCGTAGLCASLSSRRCEEYFAFSICGIIAVLYGFALAGVPEWGYHTVQALGAAAFAVCAALCAVKRDVRRRVLTPGCAVFALWILIAWWAHRGQVYNTYDEFFHWGTAANRLYALKMLPSAGEGVLQFPSYPPGSTLFYCFWTWLGSNFSEGNTIAAANVLLFACLAPLMKHTGWKQWKHLIVLALSIVLLPMVFKQNVYQDLYVDVLLGCMAAYMLITWFTGEKNASACVMTAVTAFALALVKASGIAVAVLALAVIVLDGLRGAKQERRIMWLTVGVSVFCAAAASLSWNSFLSAHDIVSEKPFRHWEILANLQSFLHGTAPGWLKDQYRNFFELITQEEMMGYGHILAFNYLEWLLVFALVACWLKRLGSIHVDETVLRFSKAAWGMIAVTAVYAVMLYHTYTYTFDYREAASLHSFDRYMSTIMTPAVCVIAALALESMHRHPPKWMPSAMIVLTCLALLVSPVHLLNLTVTAPVEIAVSQESRAQSAPSVAMSEELEGDERIAWLTVDTQRSAFDYLINRYELMPTRLEKPCDYWIQQPVEHIRDALMNSGCEYVYCFLTDEAFERDFASLFENPEDIASRTLYRIIRNGNDFTLQKVV